MTDDHELLRSFVEKNDEAAFTELVNRHLGMVHGVCQRRTGDSHLAEELAQNVFSALARKAGSISGEVLVAGWLHRASCLESLRARRSEASRQRAMNRFKELQLPPDYRQEDCAHEIMPLLDEAMDRLATADRDVVLMRFASGFTLRQIGHALGKSESATQRHLHRALEKLSGHLRKRGVTVGITTLAGFLGTDLARAAPATLSSTAISKAAIAHAATGGALATTSFSTTLIIMKQKATIAAAVLLLAAAGSAVYIQQRSSKPTAVQANDGPSARTGSGLAAVEDAEAPGDHAAARLGDRTAAAYPDLVDRFGGSRVLLATSVTGNLIDITEGLARVVVEGNDNGLFDTPGEFYEGIYDDLQLSDAQRADLDKLLARQRERKAQETRDLPMVLSANRKQLMELFLAGDAVTTGELSAEEYAAIQSRTKEQIPDFAGTSRDGIESAFGDKEALRKVLSPEQMERLVQTMGPQVEEDRVALDGDKVVVQKTPSAPGLGVSSLSATYSEPRGLEELDNQVIKLKSLTEGLIKLTEAFED